MDEEPLSPARLAVRVRPDRRLWDDGYDSDRDPLLSKPARARHAAPCDTPGDSGDELNWHTIPRTAERKERRRRPAQEPAKRRTAKRLEVMAKESKWADRKSVV